MSPFQKAGAAALACARPSRNAPVVGAVANGTAFACGACSPSTNNVKERSPASYTPTRCVHASGAAGSSARTTASFLSAGAAGSGLNRVNAKAGRAPSPLAGSTPNVKPLFAAAPWLTATRFADTFGFRDTTDTEKFPAVSTTSGAVVYATALVPLKRNA